MKKFTGSIAIILSFISVFIFAACGKNNVVSPVGPEGAAMLAEMIMAMLQQGGAPQGQPVFRRGGKLVRK